MRHRKQSPHAALIRAGALTAALAAGSALSAGTALAGSAPGQGADIHNDPDVVDADVDYVQVQDVLDGIGDFLDAGSTIS